MAEGGNLSRPFNDTLGTSSADADECFCDPCKTDGDWIAAVGFCTVCEEHFCRHCLKLHRKQKLTKGHPILDKDQMPQANTSIISPDLCVEICKTHRPEIIRFYCRKHDMPGCVDCMTLDHTNCHKERIQDVAGDFKKSTEVNQINDKLQKFHDDLKTTKERLEDQKDDIDGSHVHIMDEIKAARRKINDYLDERENEIKDKAINMKEKDMGDLETQIAENESMLQEVADLLQVVQTDEEDNVNTTFINTKHAKQRLTAMKETFCKLTASQQHVEYTFLPGPEIQNIVSCRTPFGELTRKCVPSISLDTENENFGSVLTYEASRLGCVMVDEDSDVEDCWINDCALLRGDRLVIADQFNCKINLIDTNEETILTSHYTPHEPHAVAVIDESTIAVATSKNEILVFKVTTRLEQQNKIATYGRVLGFSYKDGMFAVSYEFPGRVEIIDINGEVQDTICPKEGRENYLDGPYNVIFGHDERTVVVSDWKSNRVSIISFKGEILASYSHNDLIRPTGIAMTAEGVLFACSWSNGYVHVVSPDFKTSKVIIADEVALSRPQRIVYCKISHRLYISSYLFFDDCNTYNNRIQMYGLCVNDAI